MNEQIALLIDPEDRVRELVRLHAEAPPLAPGDPVSDLVGPGSRGKLAALLDEIRREGHAIGWELVIPLRGRAVPFQFAGARIDHEVLLFASRAHHDLLTLIDELSRINNEQTNLLRAALKERDAARRSQEPEHLYLEMSRLNNELTTVYRELALRNVRLEELNREKNELLGMAAHDLRNPLAAVLGLTRHLIGETRELLSDRHREMLDHLQSSSEHMLALVEDLLDLTSLESGTVRLALVACDLPALVDRAVRLARELGRQKKISVELRADEAPPAARRAALDPHKINQALTNVLTNAIKFSYPGGLVEVAITYAGGEATISVADHGIGIDAEHLDALFEPFRAGRPGTEGEKTTGLGLAIVRRLLRGHGGEVRVESEPGRGATFTLTLPLRPLAIAEAAAEPAGPTAPRARRALEILIADDEPLSRVLLRAELESLGHRVVDVGDATAAIEALGARPFDLAIVDVEMPGGGGRAIRGAHPEGPPIVALTAHGGDAAAAIAREDAFDGLLTKPAYAAEIAALIERVVADADQGRP